MNARAGLWLLAVLFVVGVGLGILVETSNREQLRAQHDLIAYARDAQYRACERGNVLRLTIARNTRVLAEFLAAAADARDQAAAATTGADRELNRRAAVRYRQLRREMAPQPLIDCYSAVYGRGS